MLDIQYDKDTLTIHSIIKISLVIQTITCIYNTYKKLTDRKLQFQTETIKAIQM